MASIPADTDITLWTAVIAAAAAILGGLLVALVSLYADARRANRERRSRLEDARRAAYVGFLRTSARVAGRATQLTKQQVLADPDALTDMQNQLLEASWEMSFYAPQAVYDAAAVVIEKVSAVLEYVQTDLAHSPIARMNTQRGSQVLNELTQARSAFTQAARSDAQPSSEDG